MSSDLCLEKHVSAVSANCFFHLGQIRRVWQSMDVGSAKTLVQAFVTSRVDHCNAVLAKSPRIITDKLQRVMNSAACVVTNTRKYDSGLYRKRYRHNTWRYRGTGIYHDISRPLWYWYRNAGTHNTYQNIEGIAQHYLVSNDGVSDLWSGNWLLLGWVTICEQVNHQEQLVPSLCLYQSINQAYCRAATDSKFLSQLIAKH